MEKKTYSRPVLEFEQFLPNHYCAACFTASGTLECSITNSEHGYPCHNTKFTIKFENGKLTGTAKEMENETTVKQEMDIGEINVPCGWENVETWRYAGCSNTTWVNYWWREEDHAYHKYSHTGLCKIESVEYIDVHRPYHS